MTELQDFCLRWSSYSQQLSEALRTLLDRELLVDVTLACDGRSLRAHRAVLSACSTYFQDLFQENTHPYPIVILKDVRYQELEALVKFMYHGEVTVNHDTLPGFLRTAEMLHIRGLTDDALHSNPNAASNSKVLNCTRRSVVEGHFSSSSEGNSTTVQNVLPIPPKRIKLEQPHSSHFVRSSRTQQHQDVERSNSSNSGGEEAILSEHQDSRCAIRSEDLSQLNHDQYNFQRSVSSLDGLNQLVLPVLQDGDSPNNSFVAGMCQSIPSHQQQHTSPSQQSIQHHPYQQTNSNSGSNISSRPFRQRVLYNQEQLLQLEAWYRQDRYPSGSLMKEYADTLASLAPSNPGNLGAQPMRQNVDYWFQNRRRKDFHPEVMQQREKKKLAKSLWGSYNNGSSNNASGGPTPNSGNSVSNTHLESNNSSSNNSHYDCSPESNQECSILIPKTDFSPDILNPDRH